MNSQINGLGPQLDTSSPELPEMGPLRILVAGELILDRYVFGTVDRVSPEAPIPVLRSRRREERAGNAGFVLMGLQALGASAAALSVVGGDRNGEILLGMLRKASIASESVLIDANRPTIVKERMLGSVQSANRATQQLLRVDEEETFPLGDDLEREMAKRVPIELDSADAVLISDINKGLLTPMLLRALIDGARQRGVPVIVDPRQTEDFSIYAGATVLTPNRYEASRASGIALNECTAWRAAAETLTERYNLDACLMTLDREGMYLLERNRQGVHIEASPREVYDVTGAGDVVLTVFGLLVAAGHDFTLAAKIANVAAGLEVMRIGASVVSREDLNHELRGHQNRFQRKIVSESGLIEILTQERSNGRRIVLAGGCFDLLHSGHLRMLSFARAQGDLLVIAVNSDRTIRELKGSKRPVYGAEDRARLLSALEVVDYVVIFDDLRPDRIIRSVRPDVLVKGRHDARAQTGGWDLVQEYDGRLALAPTLDGYSTSRTIDRIGRALIAEVGSVGRVLGSSEHPDGG
jgi:D-beta-D-heptose 7-phosphate kinase/D-beta-D-heptose 1-phosphate adenosyltransferase